MVKCLRWTNRKLDKENESRHSKRINNVAKIVYIFFDFIFSGQQLHFFSSVEMDFKTLKLQTINESESEE